MLCPHGPVASMMGAALAPYHNAYFGAQSFNSGRVGDGGRRPTIIANPPGDADFRALIDRFLLAGGRAPRDLEENLRTRYPQAVVRQRELAGENLEVWYVYRDGHWIRGEANAET